MTQGRFDKFDPSQNRQINSEILRDFMALFKMISGFSETRQLQEQLFVKKILTSTAD